MLGMYDDPIEEVLKKHNLQNIISGEEFIDLLDDVKLAAKRMYDEWN